MASRKELYIPVNVPEREDYISGFGSKELTITGLAYWLGSFWQRLFLYRRT